MSNVRERDENCRKSLLEFSGKAVIVKEVLRKLLPPITNKKNKQLLRKKAKIQTHHQQVKEHSFVPQVSLHSFKGKKGNILALLAAANVPQNHPTSRRNPEKEEGTNPEKPRWIPQHEKRQQRPNRPTKGKIKKTKKQASLDQDRTSENQGGQPCLAVF